MKGVLIKFMICERYYILGECGIGRREEQNACNGSVTR